MGSGKVKQRPGLLPGLFIITILYFALGFVHIFFALLAIACMSIPFILIAKTQRKTWCYHYCPRASLTNQTGKLHRRWRKLPLMFSDGYLRKILLWYFGLNLLFIIGSTARIATGAMEAMEYVRLFIAIPLPGPMPQLIQFPQQPPQWLLHLSYRLYSMMLSSSLLGIALSIIYRPRAWCTICPVGTLSNTLVKTNKTNKIH
jgi:hypothetical protein